ncbi:hypothetical protein [Amycolatopsis sp. A1MSW2902]|uniref:hypothetical protein n=1 Tax=Amycolatopsis sp. A1MSW2902 TaxID=687413 RepID=UPI00307F4899
MLRTGEHRDGGFLLPVQGVHGDAKLADPAAGAEPSSPRVPEDGEQEAGGFVR